GWKSVDGRIAEIRLAAKQDDWDVELVNFPQRIFRQFLTSEFEYQDAGFRCRSGLVCIERVGQQDKSTGVIAALDQFRSDQDAGPLLTIHDPENGFVFLRASDNNPRRHTVLIKVRRGA